MSNAVRIDGLDRVVDYLTGIGTRASRALVIPILKAAWGPVVAAERAGIKSQSGALAGSLKARAGSGDFQGRFSVFSPPTASAKQAAAMWKRGRNQQKGFAARALASGKKNYNIFYGGWVNTGHRLVKRDRQGNLYTLPGRAEGTHFAQNALAAMGQTAMEEAADIILKELVGG